uniref:5'-AMP-activated protein kinase subunit beta-1 n=1 Tax=Romanomermis culicivorax TaxID=13658 RepID=A0A915HJX0_ROMCU
MKHFEDPRPSSLEETCSMCRCRSLQKVEIRWHAKATQVFLAGNFFTENCRLLMTRDVKGHFSELNLPAGHQEFRFLVDGTWKIDKNYEKCRNKFNEEFNFINVPMKH